MRSSKIVVFAGLLLMGGAAAAAQPRTVMGSVCTAPPRVQCPDGNCPRDNLEGRGQAKETRSGRSFFLDYPCDLKPDEKLVFILLLHGAGSYDAMVREYFPAVDFKEKYRLVIATPGAGHENRIWNAQADDEVLKDISEQVFSAFGRSSIKSFWLAGHSQGGITAQRIVCNDYFRSRVDGVLSLSGTRIGPTQLVPDFFAPPPGGIPPGGTAPPVRPSGGASAGAAHPPTCDFSYIYAVGEHEIVGLPDASPLADKYHCGLRKRRADVVDRRAGYVASAQPRSASFGREARPGVAHVMVYPQCSGGRLVADVMRMDKGHTEGLEPDITEELIRLMVGIPGR
jgi:hypothetical protein